MAKSVHDVEAIGRDFGRQWSDFANSLNKLTECGQIKWQRGGPAELKFRALFFLGRYNRKESDKHKQVWFLRIFGCDEYGKLRDLVVDLSGKDIEKLNKLASSGLGRRATV